MEQCCQLPPPRMTACDPTKSNQPQGAKKHRYVSIGDVYLFLCAVVLLNPPPQLTIFTITHSPVG